MRNLSAVKTALLAAASLAATPAIAHKASDNHTHCAVGGKGVGVDGKTDAERKVACAKLSGAVWDESKILQIEAKASASEPTTTTSAKKTGD